MPIVGSYGESIQRMIQDKLFGYQGGARYFSCDAGSGLYLFWNDAKGNPSLIVNAWSVALRNENKLSLLDNLMAVIPIRVQDSEFMSLVRMMRDGTPLAEQDSRLLQELCFWLAQDADVESDVTIYFVNPAETLLTVVLNVKQEFIDRRKNWAAFTPEQRNQLYDIEMDFKRQRQNAESEYNRRLSQLDKDQKVRESRVIYGEGE